MKGTKDIWLPSSVHTNGVAVPKRVESEVYAEHAQMAQEMDDLTGAMEHYSRELQRVFNDPYIKIILAKPHTTVQGLKPNYYHIVRMQPGVMAYVKPVENPDGTWRDLDSSVFDLAAEDDLWNDRTQKEILRRRRKAEEARVRQREREAADRAREFDERLHSATHVSVAIPRSIK